MVFNTTFFYQVDFLCRLPILIFHICIADNPIYKVFTYAAKWTVPITTKVVSTKPIHGEVYSIQLVSTNWSSLQ
jgi:hypothetical protein